MYHGKVTGTCAALLLLVFCLFPVFRTDARAAAVGRADRAVSTSPDPAARALPQLKKTPDAGNTYSTSITFSEFPVGTSITSQYAPDGIVFGGDAPFITTDASNPTSPVLSGSPQFNGTITGTFVDPTTGANATVNSFQMDAGYFDSLNSTRLSVYDGSGNLISSQLNSAIGIQTFVINSPTPIGSWQIEIVSNEPNGFAVDNIGFNQPALNTTVVAIDAQLAGIVYQGNAVQPATLDALAGYGAGMLGVTADGAATLLLQLTANTAGMATFTINGAGNATLDGSLYDPVAGGPAKGSTMTAATHALENGVFQAYALYRAPIDYTNNSNDTSIQRMLTVTAVFAPSNAGAPVTVTKEVTVQRPPVILVHGLWSHGSTWNNVVAILMQTFPGLYSTALDYTPTNASSFATNSLLLYDPTHHARADLAAHNIVNIRSDVVGHSMGGVLSRLWVANSKYARPDNLFLGDIHKLISVDAPYAGSFVADGVVNMEAMAPPDKVKKFQMAAASHGYPIAAGAIDDLRTTSVPITQLDGQHITVSAFEVEGDGGCQYFGLPLVFFLYGFTFPTSTLPNDDFVTVASQGQGLSASAQTLFDDCHTEVLNDSAVANKIGALLNQPASALAPGFPSAAVQ